MNDDWRSLPQRIEDRLHSIQLAVGLFVIGFVAALMLATKTNLPTGSLFTDMALWSLAMAAAGKLIVLSAKRLRAGNFGDKPPSDPPSRQDLIGYALALLGGPLLLGWFLPRICELHPESGQELLFELRARWVDILLVGIGLGCLVWPVRAFIRYVTRR